MRVHLSREACRVLGVCRRVPRGTEGAVSLEGTLAGALASGVMAALALLGGQVRLRRTVSAASTSLRQPH